MFVCFTKDLAFIYLFLLRYGSYHTAKSVEFNNGVLLVKETALPKHLTAHLWRAQGCSPPGVTAEVWGYFTNIMPQFLNN